MMPGAPPRDTGRAMDCQYWPPSPTVSRISAERTPSSRSRSGMTASLMSTWELSSGLRSSMVPTTPAPLPWLPATRSVASSWTWGPVLAVELSKRCWASSVRAAASARISWRRESNRPSRMVELTTAPRIASAARPTSTVIAATRRRSEERQACTTRGTRAVPFGSPVSRVTGSPRGVTRPVADPTHRHDDLGVLRILLDLRAQALDVDVDQTGVGGVPVAPHLLEQHLAAEHLPRLAGQGQQEVELQRRQRDRLLAAHHLVAGAVDGEVADGEPLGGLAGGAAQAGLDPGDQFLGLERLGHVVVGPGLQPGHHVDGVGLGREHDDGHAGLGADQAADLDAVQAREHEVEQHQVGLLLAEDLQRLGTVGAQDGVIPLALQDDADHLGQRSIVIDHENSSTHAPMFAPAGPDLGASV